MRAVPARDAPFEFIVVFLYTKNFKFAIWYLGGIHFRIALNLLKSVLFCSYRLHALPF